MYFENLESRRHMSASLSARGTLLVTGGEGNDVFNLAGDGRSIAVVENGVVQLFDASKVKRVVANLGGGDDVFAASTGLRRRLVVDGGAGDDSISVPKAFVRSTLMIGGDGNDTLVGGRSADTLRGGDGNDQITGNDGADMLLGGNGDDRLDATLYQFLPGGLSVENDEFSDVLIGGNGRDTLVSSRGGDIVTGGNGSDLALLLNPPEELSSLERFGESDAKNVFLAPVEARPLPSSTRLSRDDDQLWLEVTVQLGHPGYEIDWDISSVEGGFRVSPVVYEPTGLIFIQPVESYWTEFSIGNLPAGEYASTVDTGGFEATAHYSFDESYAGIAQRVAVPVTASPIELTPIEVQNLPDFGIVFGAFHRIQS